MYTKNWQQYNLSAELHLIVTMELRQRILDLYHRCSLYGLRIRIKRRKEILRLINETPGAVSSAVPDLEAGS